jgi:hypothetical protein
MHRRSHNHFTRIMSVGLVIISQSGFVGCSTPVGVDSSDVTLSAKSLSPGQFLTVRHPAISANTTVSVTFSGSADYLITVQSAATTAGAVDVPVPVFFDLTTGEIASGHVSVSVLNTTAGEEFTITDVPEIEDVTPGAVTVAWLKVAQEHFTETNDNLDVLDQTLDSTTASQMITAQMSAIDEMISEIETNGSYTTEIPGMGDVTLSGNDLRMSDRILASYASGMVEYLRGDTAKTSAVLRDNIELPPIITDTFGTISEMSQEFRRDAVPALRAFGGGMGAIVSATGLYLAWTATTAAGLLAGATVAAVGGVVIVVAVTGTAVAVSFSSNTFSRSVKNETADLYQDSLESIEIIKDGARDIAVNLAPLGVPARLGDLFGIYSTGSGVDTYIEQTGNIGCSTSDNNGANRLAQADLPFCEVVFGVSEPGDTTAPPDATDGTDPDDGDGNESPTGDFTIISVQTTDGFMGADPSRAQIHLSGNTAFPTISFDVNDVQQLVFTIADASGTILYSVIGGFTEEGDDLVIIPINSPLRYGDYSRQDAMRTPAADLLNLPGTAPALQSGTQYGVAIVNGAAQTASIVFTIK